MPRDDQRSSMDDPFFITQNREDVGRLKLTRREFLYTVGSAVASFAIIGCVNNRDIERTETLDVSYTPTPDAERLSDESNPTPTQISPHLREQEIASRYARHILLRSPYEYQEDGTGYLKRCITACLSETRTWSLSPYGQSFLASDRDVPVSIIQGMREPKQLLGSLAIKRSLENRTRPDPRTERLTDGSRDFNDDHYLRDGLIFLNQLSERDPNAAYRVAVSVYGVLPYIELLGSIVVPYGEEMYSLMAGSILVPTEDSLGLIVERAEELAPQNGWVQFERAKATVGDYALILEELASDLLPFLEFDVAIPSLSSDGSGGDSDGGGVEFHPYVVGWLQSVLPDLEQDVATDPLSDSVIAEIRETLAFIENSTPRPASSEFIFACLSEEARAFLESLKPKTWGISAEEGQVYFQLGEEDLDQRQERAQMSGNKMIDHINEMYGPLVESGTYEGNDFDLVTYMSRPLAEASATPDILGEGYLAANILGYLERFLNPPTENTEEVGSLGDLMRALWQPIANQGAVIAQRVDLDHGELALDRVLDWRYLPGHPTIRYVHLPHYVTDIRSRLDKRQLPLTAAGVIPEGKWQRMEHALVVGDIEAIPALGGPRTWVLLSELTEEAKSLLRSGELEVKADLEKSEFGFDYYEIDATFGLKSCRLGGYRCVTYNCGFDSGPIYDPEAKFFVETIVPVSQTWPMVTASSVSQAQELVILDTTIDQYLVNPVQLKTSPSRPTYGLLSTLNVLGYIREAFSRMDRRVGESYSIDPFSLYVEEDSSMEATQQKYFEHMRRFLTDTGVDRNFRQPLLSEL